ncbi:MAG: hypothetical protein HUJ72_00695 [Blautia sp.]|nr:hypothetical protein [Blautia sp.]
MTLPIFLTFICPGAGLLLGFMSLENREIFDWKSAILCFAMFVSAVAYSYHPSIDSDLIRYMAYVEEVRDMPLAAAMQEGIHGETLWMFSLICWVIGKIGDPHVLPAFTVFVIYYIAMYITCRIGEDFDVPKERIRNYLVFILLAAPLYSITNNIRNVFSFTLVGYAVFRDVYEDRLDVVALLLYILPCSIHPSSAVIIFCRLIMSMVGKLRWFSIAIVVAIDPLLNALYGITSTMSASNPVFSLVKDTVAKAHKYYNDTTSEWSQVIAKSGASKLTKYMCIALVLLMCYFAIREITYFNQLSKTDGDSRYLKLRKMIEFCFLVGLVALSCAPMVMPEYWRFSTLMYLLGAPIYMFWDVTTQNPIWQRFSEMFIKLAVVLMLGIAALWIRNMSYCKLNILLTQPFLCCPVAWLIHNIFKDVVF